MKKLYLWPRFEASIHAALSQHPPTLYQADVPLTKQMRGVQQAIEDLLIHSIKVSLALTLAPLSHFFPPPRPSLPTLQELKRLRPSLETEYLTPEQGLFSTLEQQLRRQLDPIWDTLKPSMKQLVRDIRTLRTLAAYLLEYDAVSFYHYLEVRAVSSDLLFACRHPPPTPPIFPNRTYAPARLRSPRCVCCECGGDRTKQRHSDPSLLFPVLVDRTRSGCFWTQPTI